MKSWIVVIALIVVAVLVIIFVPSAAGITDEAALQKAGATPEAALFTAMYPYAVPAVEKKGCVIDYFEKYVKDTSVPLMARERNITCSENGKDWLVTYSATGIIDTNTLYVGVKSDGTIVDAAFISPYDDIYVLNFSFGTVMPVMETVFLNKSGITVVDGWAAYVDGDTHYLFYMMPHETYTAVAVYMEKTPGYDVPTNATLRSEIGAAHGKFVEGGKKVKETMRAGFLGDWNVTGSYLYYPTPV